MAQLTEIWRKDYASKFAAMTINESGLHTAIPVAYKIAKNKVRYQGIERETGVPWYFIGCLHEREASCDFTKYLGDGEPLNSVTHCVPKGRGPFKSFEAGAVDALTHAGFNHVTDWSVGSLLFHAEEFNGEGYHNHGLPSPYVWAGSNQYHQGKYDSDGHLNPHLVDGQLGVAVMLATLVKLGFITLPQQQGDAPMPAASAAPAATVTPIAPVVTPAASVTAGLNLSTAQVVNAMLGNLMAAVVTVGGPVLAAFSGTTTAHYVAGALFGLSGLGSLVTNTWGFLNHNSAVSSNTVATVNQLSAIASQVAGVLNTPMQANAGVAQSPLSKAAA